MMVQPQEPALRQPFVRLAREGTTYQPASGAQVVKISAQETNDALEVVEIDVVPRAGPPLHVHPGFDEVFHVTEGILTLRMGDDVVDLHRGASALVPAGTVHTWTNRGNHMTRFLQITTPGSMERLLALIASRPGMGLEELAEVSEPLGTRIVGPPMS